MGRPRIEVQNYLALSYHERVQTRAFQLRFTYHQGKSRNITTFPQNIAGLSRISGTHNKNRLRSMGERACV